MIEDQRGLVFNIQRFSLHDGPGIRTTVFLKGCPLLCLWCDNPESKNPTLELGFSRVCCDKCGKCLPACPEGAIVLDSEGMPQIDRERCNACGKCVAVCVPEALAIYGKWYSVDEVFQEVHKDANLFRRSGGGVTVSGGEPLRQSSFVLALLQRCREAGIHTAVETSGFVSPAVLREVLPFIDLVLFDLKHLDPEVHRRLTGQSNDLVLENATLVVSSGAKVQFRLPLIPGLNDTPENIRSTAQFLMKLQGEGASIELMPYHRLGVGKYQALDRAYALETLESAGPEFCESVRQAFEECGVRCLVSK